MATLVLWHKCGSQSKFIATITFLFNFVFTVDDNQVGISSISSNNSIHSNSTVGTLAATAFITYSLPLMSSINVRMTSYRYRPYNFDAWKYWWIPPHLTQRYAAAAMKYCIQLGMDGGMVQTASTGGKLAASQ